MTATNYTSLDVEGHDGSAAGLYLGVTLVTSTAAEINKSCDYEYQLLVGDGAITIKNGVCKIAKTDPGVVGATLAKPVAGTDDYKRLLVISNQAQANTVTAETAFGNGGSGENVATFSGVIGDSLYLMAYNGYWYVTGSHQCTID